MIKNYGREKMNFNKKELEQLNNKLIDISIYMYNDK